MPYISDVHRGRLSPFSAPNVFDAAEKPGELNFQLSQIIDDHLTKAGLSYTTGNAVIGVLECLKLEIYRRMLAPYEDAKIAENGDVFSPPLVNHRHQS